MKKLMLTLFFFVFVLFASQYKQENGDTIIKLDNIEVNKEVGILLENSNLSFESRARFINNKYVILYSNMEKKLNCKIYMDLKGDLIFLESESCPKFNGRYNLIKN